MISKQHLRQLATAYPNEPATYTHRFADGGLFELAALVDLARRLPASCVEYNSGDLPIDQDPAKTPMNGLSAEETVRRIAECKSWLVLKNVEVIPEYFRAMTGCLEEVAPFIEPKTGKMYRRQAYLFISSPAAVTPFHMDPEHNILMQISGSKTMYLYPSSVGRDIAQESHEAFHAGEGHRNLRYCEAYETNVQAFELNAGDAVYVPVKAPHRVVNGLGVSISFSITWRSKASDAEARLHLMNRTLRRWGANPRPPEAAPIEDAVKIFTHKIFTRAGGKY